MSDRDELLRRDWGDVWESLPEAPPLVLVSAAVRPHPCHVPPCTGTCRYVEDEYGSLAQGGSYEKWQCDLCGHITWSALPD